MPSAHWKHGSCSFFLCALSEVGLLGLSVRSSETAPTPQVSALAKPRALSAADEIAHFWRAALHSQTSWRQHGRAMIVRRYLTLMIDSLS